MKRRTFIGFGSGLVLLSAMVYFLPSFRQAVARILRSDVGPLGAGEADIERFIDEASAEQFWLKFSRPKQLMITAYTFLAFMSNILPYFGKYLQYRGQITGQFLLSTDFFTRRMDTTVPITYGQFYNPYRQPCSNPFSSIFYPERA